MYMQCNTTEEVSLVGRVAGLVILWIVSLIKYILFDANFGRFLYDYYIFKHQNFFSKGFTGGLIEF